MTDQEFRLECLKVAVAHLAGKYGDALTLAETYYTFVSGWTPKRESLGPLEKGSFLPADLPVYVATMQGQNT